MGENLMCAKKNMRIGIDALDMMLGATGILQGSTILVRGGPGTGKTTLALQIINEYVKTAQNFAAFISLEVDPERAILYADDRFHFDIKSRVDSHQVKLIGRSHIAEELKTRLFTKTGISKVDEIGNVIETLFSGQLKPGNGGINLVVIDSLNAFANMVLWWARKAKISDGLDLRDAVQMICESVRGSREDVLVFIGEYDTQNPDSYTIASESYFCDVEIQLSLEPVVQDSITSQIKLSSEAEFIRTLPLPRKRPEKRFFCRVLKSRSGPKQGRRCAYDIVDERGIEFYETYPGDGQIMLFAENGPQRSEWSDFIERDVQQMYLYPALDYNIFERSGLERTFASLRRFLYIPEATDMYLSSFDTYWVNWCVELYQRLEIVNLLRDKLNCYEKVNKEDGKFLELFCTIVGKIHRACSESFGDLDRRTQNKKVKSIIEDVCLKGKCELFKTCKYNDLNKFRTEVVEEAYEKLKLEAKQCGLLHPVMREELRIFGERRSPIIDELKNRYVIRKSKKEEKIFAVPYNANISFIVYRKELLQVLKGSIDSKALRERIIIVYKDLVGAGESAGLDGFTKVSVEETAEKLAVDFREKTDYVPETWEEVISLCELGSEVVDKQLKFLIETRTFDTFACTLLELVWSTGKRLRILPDYSIDQKGLAREILFRAFYTLHLMFDRGIIPRDSCLEPEDFAAHSSRIDSDWLFARHWYSTLIDVLSGKHESNGREHELIWQPDSNVKLDIMPIPVSLSWYTEQWRSNKRVASEEVECENGKFVPKHASCWGEWYLGIMKGTENEKRPLSDDQGPFPICRLRSIE